MFVNNFKLPTANQNKKIDMVSCKTLVNISMRQVVHIRHKPSDMKKKKEQQVKNYYERKKWSK